MSDKIDPQTIWIETYTGKKFFPLAPRPEDVCIADIAHSLSKIVRFNGHTGPTYTVAEHSVHLSKMVSPEAALYGLMHDAAEAYFSDVAKPLKEAIPEIKAIEARIEAAILERFNIVVTDEIRAEVKEADLRMLAAEKAQLMMGKNKYECLEGIEPFDIEIEPWGVESPGEYTCFYSRFKKLRGLKR